MRHLAFVLIVFLVACRPDPELLQPVLIETVNLNDQFGTRSAQVHLGAGYHTRAFYSLAHDSLVATYDRYGWEVALTQEASPRFMLNSAIPGLRLAYTGADWTTPVVAEGLDMLYDLPGQQLGDLAVGSDWAGQTFLLDRGLDREGVHRGFKKIQLSETASGTFRLQVADLDGGQEMTFEGIPDPARTKITWSLDAGQVVAEPEVGTWDLVFTSYLHVFDPETAPHPYQVTGALLNPVHGRGLRMDEMAFEHADMTASDLEPSLIADRDAVGYDWKVFDFDAGYIVRPDLTFAVTCADGATRLLSFTGFVDEAGEPGAPAFQHRRIAD